MVQISLSKVCDKLVNIDTPRIGVSMYLWWVFSCIYHFWWMRSTYSYQWLKVLPPERTHKQTLVRQWRIATHVPFKLLHFTDHSCLRSSRLIQVSYSWCSFADLNLIFYNIMATAIKSFVWAGAQVIRAGQHLRRESGLLSSQTCWRNKHPDYAFGIQRCTKYTLSARVRLLAHS